MGIPTIVIVESFHVSLIMKNKDPIKITRFLKHKTIIITWLFHYNTPPPPLRGGNYIRGGGGGGHFEQFNEFLEAPFAINWFLGPLLVILIDLGGSFAI